MSVHHGVLHALSLAPTSLPAMATLAQKNSATVSRDFEEESEYQDFCKSQETAPCFWLLSGFILHLTVLCLCFQPLKYASSASLYGQEVGSPALSASTQSGVNNKVSAWLQQTHDIDATSTGQNCLLFFLSKLVRNETMGGCVQGNKSTNVPFVCTGFYIFDVSVLCARIGSLSARTD